MTELLELSFFLAQGAPSGQPQPNPLMQMFPLAIIIVLAYMLIIRPQMKRQKEQKTLVGGLKTGDQVVTIGGIHGRITNVQENTVTVKVDDNVKLKFQRTAIDQVLKPAASAPETDAAVTQKNA